jgi:histidyl-tRNA synthetase
VIGQGHLPFYHDAELPLLLHEVWSSLPLPLLRLLVNNRKINEGVYRAIGITDIPGALRTVDKLDKIGEAGVRRLLMSEAGCDDKQADLCLQLSRISSTDTSFVDEVRALGVDDPLLDEGLAELAQVVEVAHRTVPGFVVADLHIARGFDYYTGTVYEASMIGHEDLGAVCSGGRYDNLASAGGKDVFPGVGLSIGVTRIVSRLFSRDLLPVSRKTPTCVLVALPTEDDRAACNQLAASLRRRGIPTEVADEAVKYGKQIRYAQRRGIPYVWFMAGESGGDEVRDIRSGVQQPADRETWLPPAEDLRVSIVRPA